MSDEHGTYIPIADEEEVEMPIIDETSSHKHEGHLVYDFDASTGILQLDIEKKEHKALLYNLGSIPDEGVSFCFYVPQIGDVCFTNVQQIERIKQEGGFIKRVTRILRRKKE